MRTARAARYGRSPADRDAARARLLSDLPIEEERLRLADVSTSLLLAGEGPPLVLLHGGIECGGACWAPVVSELADRHRVVIPDVPGLGESDPVARLDVATFGAWFTALLAATCAKPPTVVAHSLLGNLALRVAARHDGLVGRIVVYGAPGLGPYRIPLGLRLVAMRFGLRPTEANLERFSRWAFFDFDRTFSRDPGWFEAFAAYTRIRATDPHVTATMRRLVSACTRPIPDTELRRLRSPTALLWGRRDRFVSLAHAEATSARLAWPLHVVDDAGHVPHLERPREFLEALRAASGDQRTTAQDGEHLPMSGGHGTGSLRAHPEQGATMATAPTTDAELKSRHRAMWASGDYPSMVETWLLPLGPRLVDACAITPGARVLDVGAGTGNASLPAAALGAKVTASDLTPELLDVGRTRAEAAGLQLDWVEADAEHLPFEDASFDVVMSAIGVMFAPHHRQAADELVRVCRPGGTIGLLSWTPEGMIGALFRTMGPFAPTPPPGAQTPPLWGSEEHLRELFGDRVDIRTSERDELDISAFERPHDLAAHFKARYGPAIVTQGNARKNGKEPELEAALDAFSDEFNRGTPDRAHFRSEYLLTVGTRV